MYLIHVYDHGATVQCIALAAGPRAHEPIYLGRPHPLVPDPTGWTLRREPHLFPSRLEAAEALVSHLTAQAEADEANAVSP